MGLGALPYGPVAKRKSKHDSRATRVVKRGSSVVPTGGAGAAAAEPAAAHAAPGAAPAGAGDPPPPGKRWGPDNPHPLSTMKTELVWEGKYDEWGNRREVDIAGCAMPMQRIETIDQPRSEAAAAGQLEMFEKKTTRVDDFRNRLIWGDNKLVMASLLAEFKGKIDLIYIDPPFDVGADFTMQLPVGDEDGGMIEKDQSALEMVAYRDMWGRGTDSFMAMIHDRLLLMRGLLSENGSIYVHVGWQVASLVRLVMDEVFGTEALRNEIVWQRFNFHADANRFGTVHETIWFYAKSEGAPFHKQYLPVKQSLIDSHYKQDADGRYYTLDNPTAPAHGRPAKAMSFGGKMIAPPSGAMWRWKQENIDRLWNEGKIVFNESGMPRVRRYLDEIEGTAVHSIWTDTRAINSQAEERVGYPTQKPEALVKRIMQASSRPGDLVADFFCGSGTTGAVAEKLGRRWIMCDLGRFAIHTTRKRLIDVQRTLSAEGKPYRAFDVYNLGRYERQWWQKDALKGADTELRRVVLEFFKAEILDPAKSGRGGSPLIHGRKGRALCHVDGIDGIFTAAEARAVAQAAAGMGAKEVYCLAWDFEMDIRQRMAAIEAETGVKMYAVKIPREIMERNRTSPPPWLEVAVLEAEPVYRTPPKGEKGALPTVDIKLTKFLPSLAEVPTKELEAIRARAIKSGFDFIDFWAIDFDWSPERPFNHHWQDYRTRKDRSLVTVSTAGYAYPKPGTYTACVKVVDVFGCDTSITVQVKV
jgi:adenine-specific DNA-methyltransferase